MNAQCELCGGSVRASGALWYLCGECRPELERVIDGMEAVCGPDHFAWLCERDETTTRRVWEVMSLRSQGRSNYRSNYGKADSFLFRIVEQLRDVPSANR